jgi:Trypsin-like peptidase domain
VTVSSSLNKLRIVPQYLSLGSNFTLSNTVSKINIPIKIAQIYAAHGVPTDMSKAKTVARDTVVVLSNLYTSGSGVIINKKIVGTKIIGTIITNGHVVGIQRTQLVGQNIKIKLPSGEMVAGKVIANGIKYAPFTGEIYTGGVAKSNTSKGSIDIAVVEFRVDKLSSSSHFKAAKLGYNAKLGEKILSVGTPENSKTKRFSTGVVLDKTNSLGDGVTQVSNAVVIGGMSGGGIFSEDGNLTGINERKNCNCRMISSDGKIYNWPLGATAGGIESSTIKAFLKSKNIQFIQ